jgi:hypothetical protein
VLAAPGLDLGDLGFHWPRASAYTLVGALGLVLSVALLAGLRRRVDRGARVVATAEVGALLPRTAAERRGFARLALTAGLLRGAALPRLPARGGGRRGTGARAVAAGAGQRAGVRGRATRTRA